jgi:hypothetical protein
VLLQSPQPVLHCWTWQVAFVHAGTPFVTAHTTPQPPQLVPSDVSWVSQPVDAMASQLPQPVEQGPSLHALSSHKAAALAKLHVFVQLPQ